MTEQTIERGEKWWKIAYGFGRLSRARSLLHSGLPEAMKRAQIAAPDATAEELLAKADPEDLTRFNAVVGPQIAALVLEKAWDWDAGKGPDTAAEYVDKLMPEDVGLAILEIIGRVVLESEVTDDEKKT